MRRAKRADAKLTVEVLTPARDLAVLEQRAREIRSGRQPGSDPRQGDVDGHIRLHEAAVTELAVLVASPTLHRPRLEQHAGMYITDGDRLSRARELDRVFGGEHRVTLVGLGEPDAESAKPALTPALDLARVEEHAADSLIHIDSHRHPGEAIED